MMIYDRATPVDTDMSRTILHLGHYLCDCGAVSGTAYSPSDIEG